MKKRLGTIPKGLEWISDQSTDVELQQKLDIKKPELVETKEVQNKYAQQAPAAKRGLQEDLIRATFILRQDYLEKIKAYAYWERLQIKEVFDEMCEQFFKGKKVRSVPQRRR